jgi:hypothetical protein
MAEVHFFTEVDKLPVWSQDDPEFGQGPERAYGPVAGKESEQYRVTSTFRLRQEAMAYAVCRGTVLVQPQWDPVLEGPSATRVNLVLRPVVAPNNGFTPAHYFIYRGLLRDDFFGSAPHLLPNGDGLSDYMKQVWKDFESNQQSGNTEEDEPSPRQLGAHFDESDALLDEVFLGDESDSGSSAGGQLAAVDAGMSLGRFDSKGEIGFEIVLRDRFDPPSLEMVRKPEHRISPRTFDPSAVPGMEPIGRQREREAILNFVDPTAYFMICSRGGVSYRRNAQDELGVAGSFEAVHGLLAASHTRNTVYIDIRNENGYSLNYYRDLQGDEAHPDYGSHLRLALTGRVPDLEPVNYYHSFWPIHPVELPAENGSKRSVLLSFRNRYFPEPLLYLDFGFTAKSWRPVVPNGRVPLTPAAADRFLDEPETGRIEGWSGAFQLTFASLPGKPAHSWIGKIYLIRRTEPEDAPGDDHDALPRTAVPRRNYLGNVFGPVVRQPALTTRAVRWSADLGRRYMDASAELGVELMVDTSIIFSHDHVIFVARPVNRRYSWHGRFSSADQLQETQSGLTVSATALDSLQGSTGGSIELRQAQITQIDETYTVPIVVAVPNRLESPTYKDPSRPLLFGLALTRKEYDERVLPAATDLDYELHDVFLKLGNFGWHTPGFDFADLSLAGLNNGGLYQRIAPAGGTLRTFTADMRIIASAGALESTGLSDLRSVPNRHWHGCPPAHEQEQHHLLEVPELLRYVEEVEAIYGDRDKDSEEDSSAVKRTATRIRAHSYGLGSFEPSSPESMAAAVIFARSLPDADVSEPLIPPIPRILWPFTLDAKTYCSLTSHADENAIADNPSPYLLMAKPGNPGTIQQVDLGQVLYGFEATVMPRIADAYKIFSIGIAFDLAGLIANIATPAAEVLHHREHGSSVHEEIYAPRTANLDDYYELSAPEADLLGNADARGLARAYKNLKHNGGLRLSHVLRLYYQGEISEGLTLRAVVEPYTWKRRWLILAEELELVRKVDNKYLWLPDELPGRPLMLDRMHEFAEFWWNSRDPVLRWPIGLWLVAEGWVDVLPLLNPKLTLPVLALKSLPKFLRSIENLESSKSEQERELAKGYNNDLLRLLDDIFLPFLKNEMLSEDPEVFGE